MPRHGACEVRVSLVLLLYRSSAGQCPALVAIRCRELACETQHRLVQVCKEFLQVAALGIDLEIEEVPLHEREDEVRQIVELRRYQLFLQRGLQHLAQLRADIPVHTAKRLERTRIQLALEPKQQHQAEELRLLLVRLRTVVESLAQIGSLAGNHAVAMRQLLLPLEQAPLDDRRQQALLASEMPVDGAGRQAARLCYCRDTGGGI